MSLHTHHGGKVPTQDRAILTRPGKSRMSETSGPFVGGIGANKQKMGVPRPSKQVTTSVGANADKVVQESLLRVYPNLQA